ncbi:MAG: serine/threonine-protein kinase [Cyanobacteria bacterium J06636_27]
MNKSYQTLEAFIDENGNIQLINSVPLPVGKRVLVTILDESPVTQKSLLTTTKKSPETIKSRYRILEYIGAGGMGETYKAEDIETGAIVCVKKLRPNYSNSIFLQECKALARLNHPSIVRFIDVEDDKQPLLIMEFVDGVDLNHFLNNRVIPETIVVKIGYQLFQALKEAHFNQIIHCDLKPSNIMLNGFGTEIVPKILDFGLAVVDRHDDKSNITAIGRIAGTPLYMAPEQFRGEILSGACDVYALGLILGEMLTGKPIFIDNSNNYYKLMNAKCNQNSGIRLHNLPLRVSSSLIDLIEHCTHPNPEQRCTALQAESVLKDLQSFLPTDCVLAPTNFHFQTSSKDSLLFGWNDSKNYVDNVSNNYSIQVVSDSEYPTYVKFQSINASNSEFGSMMQRVKADYLSGCKIRFEGNLQAENVEQWCGLWLRIDNDKEAVFFDNMYDRAISGTTQPSTYAIEVDVPENSGWLNYGVILVGQGTVLVNSLRLLWYEEKKWVPIDITLR